MGSSNVKTADALPSRNRSWGFWGATASLGDEAQAHAWQIASETIGRLTGAKGRAVRAFLDARDGRHFADEVADRLLKMTLEEAIETVATRWMTWRIGSRVARELCVSASLPYLVGTVTAAGLDAGADATDE